MLYSQYLVGDHNYRMEFSFVSSETIFAAQIKEKLPSTDNELSRSNPKIMHAFISPSEVLGDKV